MPELEKGPPAEPGSRFDLTYGRRVMRGYPLSEGDIQELSYLSVGTTLFASLGTGAAGLSFDIYKDISLAETEATVAIAWWQGFQISSLGFAAICYLIAAALWMRRGSKVSKIKNETVFD